jgi:hypothetical protein
MLLAELEGMQIVFTVLAFYGPFWLAVVAITALVVLTRYYRRSRDRELTAQLLHEMLAQKMPVEEMERIMQLYCRDQKKAAEVLGKFKKAA